MSDLIPANEEQQNQGNLSAAPQSLAAIAAILGEAQRRLAEIENLATRALAAGTKLDDAQEVVATKSAHIEDARKHADNVRAELDRTLTAAIQELTSAQAQNIAAQNAAAKAIDQAEIAARKRTDAEADSGTVSVIATTVNEAKGRVATIANDCETKLAEISTLKLASDDVKNKAAEALVLLNSKVEEVGRLHSEAEQILNTGRQNAASAEVQKISAQEAANESKNILAAVRQVKAAIDVDSAASALAKRSAEEATQVTKNLAEKATTIENKISDYERKLSEIARASETQLVIIRGFLPDATSAGLAASFNDRKNASAGPQRLWIVVFVFCIAALVWVAYPSYKEAIGGTSAGAQWNMVWLGMALRLPVVIPIIWLGIYAGRNFMLSLRVAEDYAYKEAISRAFEGYKREMQGIEPGDPKNPNPLARLCLNALSAIAERPGRIYDSKQRDFSLFGEIQAAAEGLDELRKKQTASE